MLSGGAGEAALIDTNSYVDSMMASRGIKKSDRATERAQKNNKPVKIRD